MSVRFVGAVAVATVLAIDGCATTSEPGARQIDVESLAQLYASEPGGCGWSSHAPLPSYDVNTLTSGPPPAAIRKVPPIYPDEARRAGESGLVVLAALVCEHGKVVDVRVVESVPMLDAAATTCVRHWAFEPLVVEGHRQPVAVWTKIPVRFSLQ